MLTVKTWRKSKNQTEHKKEKKLKIKHNLRQISRRQYNILLC